LKGSRAHSFAPIADPDAEILILGSMPGRESLRAGQYYAHPRNAFWKIVGELLRIEPSSDYEAKTQALRSARIAVWDVLESCTRVGSLDASIEAGTIKPNDFRIFYRRHAEIRRVFFNGAAAQSYYRRHVLPGLDVATLSYLRLPSTSPAHASLSAAQKLRAWRAALRPEQPGVRRAATR
jgi:double-stranded uracil-DNA glycosylase